eukprot:63221_1
MAFADITDTAGYDDNEGVPVSSTEWACPRCTFRNTPSSNACEMCNNLRKRNTNSKSATPLAFPKWIALKHGTKSFRLKSEVLEKDTENSFNTLLLFVGYDPNDLTSTDIPMMKCGNSKEDITNSRELIYCLQQNSSKVIEIQVVLKSVFASYRHFAFHYNDIQVFKWMPQSLLSFIKQYPKCKNIKNEFNEDQINWDTELKQLHKTIMICTPIIMPQNIKFSCQKVGVINTADDLEYAWDVCKNQDIFTIKKQNAANVDHDDDIKIADAKDSYSSSVGCFKYRIDHIIWAKESWGKRGTTRSDAFDKLSLHPLLFRTVFETSMFDVRGFEGSFRRYKQHALGHETYYEPYGWTRYGLSVIGKYENDSWLHPFTKSNKKLWWRAYHGTINSQIRGRGNCIDAMANIYKNGFKIGKKCAIGQGICVSPDPSIVESHGYCGIATVAIMDRDVSIYTCCMKSFKFMLQIAVRPNRTALSKNSNNIYWCVLSPDDIRPYGILIKEVPYDKAHESHNAVPITWDDGIFEISKDAIPHSREFYD